MSRIVVDEPLRWSQLAQIAEGRAELGLSDRTRARIAGAHATVRAIIARGIRAYGVNTGVGALSDTIIPPDQSAALSRNILMSHAAGVGGPLGVAETRAIMAASVNNFARGHSGVRPVLVDRLILLLNHNCTPVVPRQGSVGYLSHRAHIGLALIGHGMVIFHGRPSPATEAQARMGLEPLVLEAKEGLSLVNGTPCAAGLGSLALARAERLMDWADAIAAMAFETQRCQLSAIGSSAMALHRSPGLQEVAASLGRLLAGSDMLAAASGRKTQDALSLRSIPQVHGAARDAWADAARVVDRELASATDNPLIAGSPAAPEIHSQAHPVGAAIGLAMDQLAVALAQLGMISERRLDRMVNPLVSGLPAFLAQPGGAASGLMIAQYTAASLVAENRRLAMPAALDGGVTCGLQEDILCHATPAALKALEVLENLQAILAIELLAACQSYDVRLETAAAAPSTLALYQALRAQISRYADDRPLGDDIAAAASFIGERSPASILQAARLGAPRAVFRQPAALTR